jgi:threonylcarbamoyladenosine tRNA methylthiotransferase MtaB
MMKKFFSQRNIHGTSGFYSKSAEKKVFITTNGCSENRYDCANMQQFFLKNGWSVANNVKDADIILFNSCGLTTVRENASIKVLREINMIKKKSAEVIVWGCFPKINEARIRKVHDGKIFSHDEAENLEKIFEANINSTDVNANFLIEHWSDHYSNFWTSLHRKNINNWQKIFKKGAIDYVFKEAQDQVSFVKDNTYYLKISTGCLNSCTYCGVRYSRGRVKSKPLQELNDLFENGLDRGYNNFTLIGTDLGAYGIDQGTNLVTLVNTFLNHSGDYKFRLPNVNPRWLIKMLPDFIDLVSTGKIEVIGSAVQSGSNRILRRMKRLHSVEDYKHAISELLKASPALQIRTNIIVGFPGETSFDFRRTLRMIKDVDFTYADVHKFAPRPGTIAAEMMDKVNPLVINLRYYKVFKAFAQKCLKRKYQNIWPTILKRDFKLSSSVISQ